MEHTRTLGATPGFAFGKMTPYTHVMTAHASFSLIKQALELQVTWCTRLGSPFTALLLSRAVNDLETEGPLAALVKDYPYNPVDSVLALRLAGAFHGLVLSKKAPRLAKLYPPHTNTPDPDVLWQAAAEALIKEPEHFQSYIARPVQTNELRRCNSLLGGFFTIASHTSLPLRLLEIGASGGLNLMWDRYCYHLGDRTWGDRHSPVHLDTRWQGVPPPLQGAIEISARAGCDLHPIDWANEQDYRRVLSYIWPDQQERMHRFEAAARLAGAQNFSVSQADAADWLGENLAARTPGLMTVVFHSYVWQYLSAATQATVTHTIEAAGGRADRFAPMAWLRMEPVGERARPALFLTQWPGGDTRRCAWCHPHGHVTDWDAMPERVDSGA